MLLLGRLLWPVYITNGMKWAFYRNLDLVFLQHRNPFLEKDKESRPDIMALF
jgi:hypothetical protein